MPANALNQRWPMTDNASNLHLVARVARMRRAWRAVGWRVTTRGTHKGRRPAWLG